MRHEKKRIAGSLCEVMVHDSVSEMVEWIVGESDRGSRSKIAGKIPYENGGWIGRKFSGCHAAAEAVNGNWEEGMQLVEKFAEEIRRGDIPEPVSRQRRREWSDDTGDEFCHDRLRAGQDFWQLRRRQYVSGPSVITLALNISASAFYSARDLAWRAAAAAALCGVLEESGYGVELWAASQTERLFNRRSVNSIAAVQIKGAGDPLNLSAAVNAMAPWFYRTMWFSMLYLSPVATDVYDSLGTVVDLDQEHMAEFTADTETQIIQECWSYSNALDQCRNILNWLASKQGE